MADATIPLAKGYTPAKLKFPVYLSTKYDGVPVRIDIKKDGTWTARTRQDEPMYSVHTLVHEFVQAYLAAGNLYPATFVGEVLQRADLFAPFKDTSGIVRRQYDQSDLLMIKVFDYDCEAKFSNRIARLHEMLMHLHNYVRPVFNSIIPDIETLDTRVQYILDAYPVAEGLVARSYDDTFVPGKRSWGYQKILREPTVDLRIVGFEEAMSASNEPLGMVGRLVAEYNGTEIGIGPGKLTHDERKKLWKEFMTGEYEHRAPCIATVKYKKDDSYAALRQPTFQHWRPEKTEPSYE